MRRLRKLTARHNLMDFRSIILAVLVIALITTVFFAMMNINRPLMLIFSAIFLVAGFVSYWGYYIAGSWTALFTALIGLTYLFYSNNGIRDTALLGLIVVLVSAGLLAGKTGTVVIGSLLMVDVGIFAVLESQKLIVNKFSAESYFADYLAICVFIAMITVLQWLVISRLNLTIQIAGQELSERLMIEDKLRSAEARYRNLVEKLPLVIYISEPGQSGAWSYVSPQITELTGYTPEEWLNDPHLWFSRIHPDDQLSVLFAETKSVQEGKMPKMEYRLFTRDGDLIWIYDESLLLLDNEHQGRMQGFLLDITASKQNEELLQKRLSDLQAVQGVSETLVQKTDLQKLIYETGEQLRLSLEADNLLIAIHDPTTNLIHFPYDIEEGKLQSDKPIRYGDGMSTQIMEMKKPLIIQSDWKKRTEELHIINVNNSMVLSSVAVPIMTGEKVIGLISLESTKREAAFGDNDARLLSTIAANLAVAIENIRLQDSLQSELDIQEKLVKELEAKNQELERFTYTASHDLKSPLITIRGFLGYLEQDARSGNLERLGQDIQRISDATEKMHRLLSELLELSRVGRVMKDKTDVPFLSIVTEALRRVEGQLKERQVTVKIRGDFPVVKVDEERIIEVMQNLLDNAIKFMGNQTHPEIEIDYLIENGQVVFCVKDNGVGIRKEFQERIFGLFDKLHPNTPGTGVGLALVKRIIEVHGGKIWVESDGSTGTTFFFTLPETK